MRKLGILFIVLFRIIQALGQCPAGDLIIQNQAQVNYFVDQCPDVDTIKGALIIGDTHSDISDISGLLSLKVVLEGLTIQHNDSLTTLAGLDSIHSLSSWLSISDNLSLQSLSHLDGILDINGPISINQNEALEDLNGLKNITSFNGDLLITENNNLVSIQGLSSIKNVIGSVRIHGNNMLSNLKGLDSLTNIQGDLTIQSNDALQSLSGLDSLVTIGNSCSITYNASLMNLDAFANLTSIGADLYIGSNESLADCSGICDLLNDNGIGGSISIGDNPSECSNNSEVIPLCQALPTFQIPQPKLAISPNPASQELILTFDAAEKIDSWAILTLSGHQVQHKKYQNKHINISNMSAGMYILALYTRNRVIYRKIVIK